ncbi:MAG: tetratricopeptide repeat protein [Deltaproteobacteria bacterium]|nr:tetratricopeptide repeat protein [Deltaproteobacteria bacterium]
MAKIPYLIILTVFLYLPALWAPFEFDDRDRILDNPAIRNLSNIPAFFYSRELMPFGGEIYRPLSDTSFAIEYSVWGNNPRGYHLTNIFIHTINSILLYILLQQIFRSERVSFAASLLFAWHPALTEAVIWIKGREDLIVASFYLLTLLLYRSYGRIGAFKFLPMISFTLALLSKEMAVTIPIILLMFDIYERKGIAVSRYMPYVVITFLYLLVRYLVLGQVAQTEYWGGGILQTLYTMSRVTMYYIKLLIFPVNLCLDYLGYPVSTNFAEPYVILSLSSILLMVASGGYLLWRHHITGFSVIGFFVMLIPVSNIIPLKILLAERFLYLPAIGLAFIYAWAFQGNSWSKWRRSAMVIVMVSFASLTIQREYIWISSSRLWEDTVRKMPYNERGHLNLGSVYLDEGRFKEAIRESTIVLKLNPFDPEAYVNRGLGYASMGKRDEALRDYRQALMINPRLSKAHHNMGNLYLNGGDLSRAIEEFEAEMRINPNKKILYRLYETYLSAGNGEFEKGDYPLAAGYYTKAVKLAKELEEGYINLSLAHFKMGDIDAAIKVYEDLLKVRPDLTLKVKEKISRLRKEQR